MPRLDLVCFSFEKIKLHSFSYFRAFVPLDIPNKKNSTEWEKVKLLFEELGSSHGLAALSFSISSLTLIGMVAAITYTVSIQALALCPF
ncbi:putative lysosomal cobalamin transporter [Varanus komodoensis]|nr:putative lysosomal cobalamin transporter [Varanus komodoensis]